MEALDEIVQFDCGECRLAGRLSYPANGRPTMAAVLMGAHPLLGGDVDNNVIAAIRHALAAHGAAALSFAYRGTRGDDSAGLDWERMIADFWRDQRVPEEALWLEDARAACRWLRTNVRARVVLFGYSFGCRLLSELLPSREFDALVCLSPNPAAHDLTNLARCGVPLLVVSSDNDFSCSIDDLRRWFEPGLPRRSLIVLHGAEHFFRNRESELTDTVLAFLSEQGLLSTLV